MHHSQAIDKSNTIRVETLIAFVTSESLSQLSMEIKVPVYKCINKFNNYMYNVLIVIHTPSRLIFKI